MLNKVFRGRYIYFVLLLIVSFYYIFSGYSKLGTNDDWALWGMLSYKGIYGTLIMSYPMSFFISHLYDFAPTIPWYSILLSVVIALNFYIATIYIESNRNLLERIALFFILFLFVSYQWFAASITTLTVVTMISAVGLLKKDLYISLLFLFLAFLLRSDIMFITLPYYIVSYFILRDSYKLNVKEFLFLLFIIALIAISLYIQYNDKFYIEWLQFNKARSAIIDLKILNVPNNFFTTIEQICYQVGWFQDETLLNTNKLISTTPSFLDVLNNNLPKLSISHLIAWIKLYKFNYLIYILLSATFIILLFIKINNIRKISIVIFTFGVILLLLTRDVERVTVPLIIMWLYIIYETIRVNKAFSNVFLIATVYILYTYMKPILHYNHYIENSKLLKEAKELIVSSKKACEVSVNFPTSYSNKLNTILYSYYLFHEQNWLQINNKEILPTGWLVRHEFFYKTHNISDKYTKRKYNNYHEFLVDKTTAFFGSKRLVKNSKPFELLLKEYDNLYLKDNHNCHHQVSIIKESKHFAISQIQIVCDSVK